MAVMAGQRATIVDVAQAAGVSVKTVSRVINREPHVREKLVAKVEAAIASLGFVPNSAARSLAGTRSFVIGAFFDNPSPFYLATLQAGAMQACRAAGYHLIIEQLDLKDEAALGRFEQTLRTVRLDGAILSPPVTDNPRVLALLETRGIPCVRLAPLTEPERSPALWADDEAGASAIARHLCELGHRHIGFVAGPPDHGASARRRVGFYTELERRGVSVSSLVVVEGDFSFDSGMAAGMKLLGGHPQLTAVFAANDDMAAGVLAAAARLKISVPEDVSVAGFDDSPAATFTWPQITTARQPIADMSAAAARMLIEKGAPKTISVAPFPVMLVARGSTGPSRDIVRQRGKS